MRERSLAMVAFPFSPMKAALDILKPVSFISEFISSSLGRLAYISARRAAVSASLRLRSSS